MQRSGSKGGAFSNVLFNLILEIVNFDFQHHKLPNRWDSSYYQISSEQH